MTDYSTYGTRELIERIKELESNMEEAKTQLSFLKEADNSTWTEEYKEGYIDGMEQAFNIIGDLPTINY